jgi:ParB family chromosome partitioning protein
MSSKFRLGKGLDALLPLDDEASFPGFSGEGGGDAAAEEEIIYMGINTEPVSIPLDKLSANPNQPRKNFNEEALQELADSIRKHGIIQPLLVENTGDGTYAIIAGERRSRAARIAGLTEVPALIRSYTDEQRMEISLIENIQRADLNPVEEAMAYRQLMDLTGLSQDEVAARVGKNRATVANTLRLLKLPPAMLKALQEGGLSPGHGRALLAVAEPAAQEILFQEILNRSISVREAEKRAGDLNAPEGRNPAKNGSAGKDSSAGETGQANGNNADYGSEGKKSLRASTRDPELNTIEQQFIDVLGTKVTIEGDLKKGKIHIEYYSMDDLDRLLKIIKKPE